MGRDRTVSSGVGWGGAGRGGTGRGGLGWAELGYARLGCCMVGRVRIWHGIILGCPSIMTGCKV